MTLGSISLYALEVSKGKLKWKHSSGSYEYSTPLVADGLTICSRNMNIYALDVIEGTLKWKFEMGDNINYYSRPVVVDSTVYAISTGYGVGYICALDAKEGTLKWKFKIEGGHSNPLVLDNTLYVGSWNGYVYALDTKEGLLNWKFKIGYRVYATPAVEDHIVYVGLSSGYIYAFTTDY